MGKQYQAYTKEPVYPTVLNHTFTSAVTPVVNAGAFPATGDKIALSAAQTRKAMSPGGLSATEGDIALDDSNDRILLEPGVYEVEVDLMLVATGTASNFSVALTTAAQAATDVSFANVNTGTLAANTPFHFSLKREITVTAARALELHVAWTTAGATGTFRPGSSLRVRKLGNVE